jgi:hypothetical protein
MEDPKRFRACDFRVVRRAVSHQKRRSAQLAWLQSEIQKGVDSGPAGVLDIEKIIQRGRRRVAARARRARS